MSLSTTIRIFSLSNCMFLVSPSFGRIAYSSLAMPLWTRSFSSTIPMSKEKYYKILRYVKPVDTTVYKAGDSAEGLNIPTKKPTHPDYKYEAMFFKRQNRGLFGGLQRTRSKTCSEAGNKNLRAHLPNIVKTKLWSESLNRNIETTVTTTVLRTITKEGGLDNYLTKDTAAREKTLGLKGWKLRYEVMKQREMNKLPAVEVGNQLRPVLYVHRDGKKVVVGRNKLLKYLYPEVKRDSYTPLAWPEFLKNHTYLSTEEIVDKLESYGFDFSKVAA